MGPPVKHITVCICTYKRGNLLMRLLTELEKQKTDGRFTYSAVVVDNDANRSAQQVVSDFQQTHDLDVEYHVEQEQNIALARNKAVESSRGDFIAFIDDDEFPEKLWLLNLFTALETFQSAGVLGPVKPHFEETCPGWIIKSGLCDRKSYPTGTMMPASDTRTGNVLLTREIFDDVDNRFDRAFGRSGGSDVHFFTDVMRKGYAFVWCDEAVVYETVVPERWKASFYLKRAARRGGLSGLWMRKQPLSGRGRSFAVAFAAACIYTSLIPFAALLGKHWCIKSLEKSAYHLAWLSGFFGHLHVPLRDD